MGCVWGYFSLLKKHCFILRGRILVYCIQAVEEALQTGPADTNVS